MVSPGLGPDCSSTRMGRILEFNGIPTTWTALSPHAYDQVAYQRTGQAGRPPGCEQWKRENEHVEQRHVWPARPQVCHLVPL